MYAQKKPIDNTHIVREKDRQRNRELLAVLFLGVPIGLFLLLFTWQNLEVIRLGSEATRLQKQLKETEAAHKQLESELDRLTSFAAVEKQAAQLGFSSADPQTIVMVEAGDPRAHSETLRADGAPQASTSVAATSGEVVIIEATTAPPPQASLGPPPAALGAAPGGR